MFDLRRPAGSIPEPAGCILAPGISVALLSKLVAGDNNVKTAIPLGFLYTAVVQELGHDH
jgi:hypothetical protein